MDDSGELGLLMPGEPEGPPTLGPGVDGAGPAGPGRQQQDRRQPEYAQRLEMARSDLRRLESAQASAVGGPRDRVARVADVRGRCWRLVVRRPRAFRRWRSRRLRRCEAGAGFFPFGEEGAGCTGLGEPGTSGGGAAGILPSAPGVPRGTPRLFDSSTVLADTTAVFSASPDAIRFAIRLARTSPLRFALFKFSQSRWTSSAFLFTAFLVLTTEASIFRSRRAASSAAAALASCLSMIALASSQRRL